MYLIGVRAETGCVTSFLEFVISSEHPEMHSLHQLASLANQHGSTKMAESSTSDMVLKAKLDAALSAQNPRSQAQELAVVRNLESKIQESQQALDVQIKGNSSCVLMCSHVFGTSAYLSSSTGVAYHFFPDPPLQLHVNSSKPPRAILSTSSPFACSSRVS